MFKKDKLIKDDKNIFIHIDHLKTGEYTINIMQNKKAIKSIRITKS